MDNTLITFPNYAGMKKMAEYLNSCIGQNESQKACAFLDGWYYAAKGFIPPEGLGWLEEANLLLNNLMWDVVVTCKESPSELTWSRELWLCASLQSISPYIAMEAANSFWNGIATKAHEWEDSYGFLRWLRRDHPEWELVVVSSSDSHLYVKDDKFVYDPEYSDEGKQNRIPTSLFDISGNNIFVGDPISKPRPEFWERVLTNIGYNQREDTAIMVGDSYSADIIGVSQFGIIPILIDREGETKKSNVPEAKHVINNFCALQDIIENLEKTRSG